MASLKETQRVVETPNKTIVLTFPHCNAGQLGFTEKQMIEFQLAVQCMITQNHLVPNVLKGIQEIVIYPNAKIYQFSNKMIVDRELDPNSNDVDVFIRGALYVGDKFQTTTKLLFYEDQLFNGLLMLSFQTVDPIDVDVNHSIFKQVIFDKHLIEESTQFDEMYNGQDGELSGLLGDENCFAFLYGAQKYGNYVPETKDTITNFYKFLLISTFHRKESRRVQTRLQQEKPILLDEFYTSDQYKKSLQRAHENRLEIAKIVFGKHDQMTPSPEINLTWNTISEDSEDRIYYYSNCFNLKSKQGNGIVLGLPTGSPHLIFLKEEDDTKRYFGNYQNRYSFPMVITMKLKPSQTIKNLQIKPSPLFKRSAIDGARSLIFWNEENFQKEQDISLSAYDHFDELTNNKTNFKVLPLFPIAGITSSPKWNEFSARQIMDSVKFSKLNFYWFPINHPFIVNSYLPNVPGLLALYNVKKKTEPDAVPVTYGELVRTSTNHKNFLSIPKHVVHMLLEELKNTKNILNKFA